MMRSPRRPDSARDRGRSAVLGRRDAGAVILVDDIFVRVVAVPVVLPLGLLTRDLAVAFFAVAFFAVAFFLGFLSWLARDLLRSLSSRGAPSTSHYVLSIGPGHPLAGQHDKAGMWPTLQEDVVTTSS